MTTLASTGKACVQCAVHGFQHCGETVGTCRVCGQRKDIYTYRSGAYEQTPENLCLDCLDSGSHLESAHDPSENPPESGEWAASRPVDQGGYQPTWSKPVDQYERAEGPAHPILGR